MLERINKLGNVGDTVNVKSGYARNHLLPKGMALFATEKARADFESRREYFEKKAEELRLKNASKSEKLGMMELDIVAKAGEGGKLYGSIGVKDIVDLIAEKGLEVAKTTIQMPGGSPIRQLGSYLVTISIGDENSVDVPLKVIAEE